MRDEKGHGRSDRDGSYEVGYGKPPKANQFAKGRSGNPGGKSKAGDNADYIETILSRKLPIRREGKRLTGEQLLLEKTFALAASGSPPHLRIWYGYLEKRLAALGETGCTEMVVELVLEDRPPCGLLGALEQLATGLNSLGLDIPDEARNGLEALVTYYCTMYPSWGPGDLLSSYRLADDADLRPGKNQSGSQVASRRKSSSRA